MVLSNPNNPGIPDDAYLFSVGPSSVPALNDNINNFSVTQSNSAFCFLTGTRISTPQGAVAVENLNVGDEVTCADGTTTRVFWVGKKTTTSVFTSVDNLPVEIAAGALGQNIPQQALRVMPAHAVLIDNTLVVAGQLVNGASIRRLSPNELGETFTYYAVETEGHSVILAEGVPVESKGNFKGNSEAFDNWDEYVRLYGEHGRDYLLLPYERIRMIDELPTHIYSRINALVAQKKVA